MNALGTHAGAPATGDAPVAAGHAADWALVAAAAGGDREAFGELYARHRASVFRYVLRRVRFDRHLAEDITSDTFLHALRGIATVTYQGRGIGAWLFTIAQRRIWDYLGSGRYRFEVAYGDVPEPDPITDSPQNPVPVADVMRAVAQLTPAQQECITLRFLQGSPTAIVVGDVMGKSPEAVYRLQHRALHKLAGLLAAPGQPDRHGARHPGRPDVPAPRRRPTVAAGRRSGPVGRPPTAVGTRAAAL